MKICIVVLLATLCVAAPTIINAQPGAATERHHRQTHGNPVAVSHNPMLQHLTQGNAQQKTAAAGMRLARYWGGDATIGSGGSYPTIDTGVFSYASGRGGVPYQAYFGSNYGTFSLDKIDYTTDVEYNDNGTPDTRYTRSFDGQGRVTQELEEAWSSGTYSNDYRTLYAYSGNNLFTSTQQSWDAAHAKWLNYTLDSFLYNSSGRLTDDYYKLWSQPADTVQYFNRTSYTTDGAGNITSTTLSARVNGIWKNFYQNLYAYNSSNQQTSFSLFDWDSASAAFNVLEYSNTSHYNSSNQLLYEIGGDSVGYKATGRSRATDSTVNISLNAAGYPLTTIDYTLVGSVTKKRKWEETYNADNLITSEYITHWDGTAFVIGSLDYAYRYYYEPYNLGVTSTFAADTKLVLSPNPASRQIHILLSSPSAQSYHAVIVDATGSVVRQWQTGSVAQYESSVDLSELPAGRYWLMMANERGQISSGFVLLGN